MPLRYDAQPAQQEIFQLQDHCGLFVAIAYCPAKMFFLLLLL